MGSLTFAYWKFDLFGAFTAASTSIPSWPPTAGLPDLFHVVPYGDVRFRGHRISAFMVFDLFRRGLTPEDAIREFPTLSPEKAEEALIYYRSRRAEIDPAIDGYHRAGDFNANSLDSRKILAKLRARMAEAREAVPVDEPGPAGTSTTATELEPVQASPPRSPRTVTTETKVEATSQQRQGAG